MSTSNIIIISKFESHFSILILNCLRMEKVSSQGSSRDPVEVSHHSLLKSPKEPILCRICLEPEFMLDDLRSPCACKGSIKHVHETCLKKWIECKLENATTSEREKMLIKGEVLCELCKKKISF